MSLLDTFRTNIRYYRYQKNYSQEKLGEMTGLSTHYISDLERGRYSPPIPTIENIAKTLGIQPNLLFVDNIEAQKLSSRIDIHRKKTK